MDFRLDFMKLASILALCPKPLKPCVSFYVSTLAISIRAEHFSFVVRMITNVPSKIRQMAEFIRPLVEERLTKLEEFGETWDGAPVRLVLFFCAVSLSLIAWEHRTICSCG
jgi:hypothetical protein